jgi:glycopeptide antibiotics resistance protein
MLELLKKYVALFNSPMQFIGHKSVHVFSGMAIGLVVNFILDPVLALAIVLIVAIIKELVDDYMTAGPYQEPMYSNILDIIVTGLGGLIGILIYHLIPHSYVSILVTLMVILVLDSLGLYIAELYS